MTGERRLCYCGGRAEPTEIDVPQFPLEEHIARAFRMAWICPDCGREVEVDVEAGTATDFPKEASE